ncbi:MAG: glycerol kinase GlpK [Anaerolineae bacterium]|nr:glycerol kinase GlpK [Anaerolineae bacterium]
MSKLILAIDQGTTGTRAILFNQKGENVASAYARHQQIFPQPGWVEHDPLEIWRRTQETIQAALEKGNLQVKAIEALGITNQRETTIIWDKTTGQPYANAIVWQCTRTQQICQKLIDEGLEPLFRERTGLPISTYFSGTKIKWLLENIPGLRAAAERGQALFGTIDTWLIWNLTGGAQGGAHIIDVTNASRTMLMNLKTLDWDPDLLEILNIPRALLPEIRPSSDRSSYGTATLPPIRGVPLCGDLGDQQAALVGQTCFSPGEAKNTYGTGSFLLMHTGERPIPSTRGLLTTVAYGFGPGQHAYALEGSIAITGAAIQWLRDNLGLIQDAAETETLAASVPDTGGVYFVPAFSGLFAPHWDMYARGAIVGLTRYTTKAHLVRATLEAICYRTREVIEAMEADSGIALQTLKVDGGATVNNLLMQLQADILGKPVIRPTVQETTALGAAYAAGLASGFWPDLASLCENWRVDTTFAPQWSQERRAQGYAGWRRAVERAKGWIEPQNLQGSPA